MSADAPPSYTRAAELLAIFACLPLGRAAQVHAREADARLAAGDLEGAEESAARARQLCWFAAAAGFFIWALAIAGVALLSLAEAKRQGALPH